MTPSLRHSQTGNVKGCRSMNSNFIAWKEKIGYEVSSAKELAKKEGKRLKTNFSDSELYERLMRCGIEARVFNPVGDDEHFEIARLTLMQDAARNKDFV